MNINEHVAHEIIRERVNPRTKMQRPAHPRAARILRRWAERLDETR
jgi:hypothetical protein